MKLIALSLLLAILPAFQASPKKHKYAGPKCLGGFCFHGGSKKNLAAAFGKLPKNKMLYCHKTSDAKAYLQYEIDDEYRVNGGLFTIGEVVITDFPNCPGEYSLFAGSAAQAAWQTPEGIGLGSSEQDVIRAYGKPVKREEVTAKSVASSMIVDGHGESKEVPADVGGILLTYNSDYADLRLTWILLRQGKVSGIRLGDVE